MEFRELKNDHASLKHPSPARPVQASSIGHVLLVIPDITSYVIHIGGVHGTPAVFVYIMRPFLESSQLCPSTIIVTLNLVKTVLLDKNGKMNQRQDRSGTCLCSKIQRHGKNPPTPECFQVLTIYGHSSLLSSYAKLCPRVNWLFKTQRYRN
ncbi:hypothetical protein QLX08_010758 [Tetragonisca angustula]|uniref:Uncharacterized protein n=1 Tax=Tetragonisca angustula TaxID=166442 RepID=A0AAW0ZAY1_9HYME